MLPELGRPGPWAQVTSSLFPMPRELKVKDGSQYLRPGCVSSWLELALPLSWLDSSICQARLDRSCRVHRSHPDQLDQLLLAGWGGGEGRQRKVLLTHLSAL